MFLIKHSAKISFPNISREKETENEVRARYSSRVYVTGMNNSFYSLLYCRFTFMMTVLLHIALKGQAPNKILLL